MNHPKIVFTEKTEQQRLIDTVRQLAESRDISCKLSGLHSLQCGVCAEASQTGRQSTVHEFFY